LLYCIFFNFRFEALKVEAEDTFFSCCVCQKLFSSEDEHFGLILNAYVEEIFGPEEKIVDSRQVFLHLGTKLSKSESSNESESSTEPPDFVCGENLLHEKIKGVHDLVEGRQFEIGNIIAWGILKEIENSKGIKLTL